MQEPRSSQFRQGSPSEPDRRSARFGALTPLSAHDTFRMTISKMLEVAAVNPVNGDAATTRHEAFYRVVGGADDSICPMDVILLQFSNTNDKYLLTRSYSATALRRNAAQRAGRPAVAHPEGGLQGPGADFAPRPAAETSLLRLKPPSPTCRC